MKQNGRSSSKVRWSSSDEHVNIAEQTQSEKKPLISSKKAVRDVDDVGYRKFSGLDIDTTCWHWLIGPVVFSYIFSAISSNVILVEYNKHYFQMLEFDKANVTVENTTSTVCDVDTNSTAFEAEQRASAQASTWNVYYSIAGGLPAILANIILGSYTDTIGRKLLLGIGICGSILRLGFQFVVIYFELPLWYLLIGCFVDGCAGQYAMVLQVSLAYIADITKPGSRRIFGIIYIEFVLGVGLSSASFASGFMVEALGFEYAMAIAAGVVVVDLFFMTIVLPETFSKEFRHKDKSIRSVVKSTVSFFTVNDIENRRWKYQIVLLIHFLCSLSFLARMSVETLYQLASPFCWSVTKIGVYAAVRTVIIMCVGLGSVPLLQKYIDEIWICIIGSVSYGAAFFWTAFVEDDTSYYIIIIVGMFGPLSTTMQRSILSHLTPPEKQGAIFSAVGTIEMSTSLVSNVINGYIYAATVSTMSGIVFLVLGGYNVVCILLLLILKVGWNLERKRKGYTLFKEIVVENT